MAARVFLCLYELEQLMNKITFLRFKEFKRFCLMGVMVVFTSASLPDIAQAQTVSKRLEIIEKQLKAVQRKVFTPGSKFPQQSGEQTGDSGSMTPRSNIKFADIEARLSQMETQLRQLTGRVEEGNFQMDKLRQQLEVMSRDYEFRFKELETLKPGKSGKPGAGQPVVAEDTTISKTAEILPAGTEQQKYSYAQKLVTTGQYAKAEAALSEFIKKYPEAALAGNAQYWLGQTYYVRKMYTKATRAFLEGYNEYPKSPKAPAFLLKIGMSLNAMGEKKDACDAYRELDSRFPDSLESKKTRPAEARRAGCN
ncbi:Cell division coordinator CpoB [hydrothermal vent metagenome]|uniref:Cell division coordinator CpoB n=1 Tax=hydrothermal vent metagenome TaxID=652676 RepID=A0A3B1AJ30_9ZZZZ